MIRVARRYHRSISLSLDWGNADALSGYLVSPMVRSCTERFLEGVSRPGGCRAWSIVGPYGTGKSAFVLYLATLLATQRQRSTLVRQLDAAPEIVGAFTKANPEPWMPVLVEGQRAPILETTARALLRALEAVPRSARGQRPRVEHSLRELVVHLEEGGHTTGNEVLSLIDDVLAYAKKRHSGVVFVFDELGKFLEYAANEPTRSDIFFLQQLAEQAARTTTLPLAVVTVLHQSFALYAQGLPEREQHEWEKVQGRFEEIPFLEPVDHLVRLAGNAVTVDAKEHGRLLRRHAEIVDELARHLPDARAGLISALRTTCPLHPVVAALLGPVFRGALAQNERSLFAFLVSTEPGGFGAFVRDIPPGQDSLYDLATLYEYVTGILSTRVARRSHDRLWGLAERALAGLTGQDHGARALVVKALTLLDRFGEETGLGTSLALLSISTGLPESVVEGHLEALGRHVVHRQFSDTYHLWDGSDVDLERELQEARQRVEHAGNIAAVLERHISLRPVVAGRHLHLTGTIRSLEPRLVEETAFDGALAPEDPCNGLILYVLPRTALAGRRLAERLRREEELQGVLTHDATIIAIAHDAERLREQALALLSLDNVLTTSREVSMDPVARRELEIQLGEASNRLLASLGHTFGWGAQRSGQRSWWFTKQGECEPPQRISKLASDVMDQAFHSSPAVQNELLNRTSLSSQAAKARRELVEAMILQGHEVDLGFEGHPPSLAMYLSVVQQSGMHAPGSATPWTKPAGKLGALWDDTLEYLEQLDEPVAVDELYRFFASPPYGVREAVMPVVLVGQLLAQHDRLTLFEEGSLVPILDVDIAARLLTRPKTFTIRAFASSDGREKVLKAILEKLDPKRACDPTLINATKALLKVVRRLSDYAKGTNSISREAKGVRTAILSARDPYDLIYNRLPRELNFDGDIEADARGYVTSLIAALEELNGVEGRLLQRLFSKILLVFGAADQAEVVARCADLPEGGMSSLVTGFRLRAQEGAPQDEWVFSIATFLVHRPPDKWRDSDEAVFDLKIRETARLFRRYEQVAHRDWSGGIRKMYLSVLDNDGSERADVIILRDEEAAGAEKLARSIEDLVAREGCSRDQMLRAVAQLLSHDAAGNVEGLHVQ